MNSKLISGVTEFLNTEEELREVILSEFQYVRLFLLMEQGRSSWATAAAKVREAEKMCLLNERRPGGTRTDFGFLYTQSGAALNDWESQCFCRNPGCSAGVGHHEDEEQTAKAPQCVGEVPGSG